MVTHDPPIVSDFFSERLAGRWPVRIDVDGLDDWYGISVYDKLKPLADLARWRIRRGYVTSVLIAEIVIGDHSGILGRRMGPANHWNLFTDPESLVVCFGRIAATIPPPL